MEIALQRLGRIFIGLLFFIAGLNKAMNFDGTVQYMQSAGLPFAGILCFLTIILLIACSLMLLTGVAVQPAALVLIVWLTIVSLTFHLGPGQFMVFIKNLAIIGGLFALAANE